MYMSFAFKTSIVEYKIRAQALNLQNYIKSANKFNYFLGVGSIFIKFSHSHVYELCHSRLVFCSTRAKLKPFQVSQKVQTNSNIYFHLSIFMKFSHLHSLWAPSKQSNHICHTLPWCEMGNIKVTTDNINIRTCNTNIRMGSPHENLVIGVL